MTQTKDAPIDDAPMEDRLRWENELRELLGAKHSFWKKAAPFGWALNQSHQIKRALNKLLNWLTLGAWCWMSGFGLGAWRTELLFSASSAWAGLGALNVALMLISWMNSLGDMSRLENNPPIGLHLLLGLWMALILGLGVRSGRDEGFKLITALPWAGGLFALHMAAKGVANYILRPLNEHFCWHLSSARHQWSRHLQNQGFDPLVPNWSESKCPILNAASSNEWLKSDVDWLALHESDHRRSRERPKLPKRLFRILSQATEKLRARGWISWAPLGLDRMSAERLEKLAQAWIPEALERTRERFELSSALPSAPKKASSSRL